MQALVTQRRCDICIKAWPFCRPPACLWPCAWPLFKPHILPGFVSSSWLAQGHGIGFISSHPFGWAWAAGLANTFHKSSLTALCFWFHGCKNEPLLPCCLPKILACMSRKSWNSGICTSEPDGMPNEIWVPAGTSSPVRHELAAKHNAASISAWHAELHQTHPLSWKSRHFATMS